MCPKRRAAARAGLADESASTRHAAISVAGVWRDAAAKNALLDVLRGDDPPLQRAAAEALGRLGDASALPDLFAALEKMAPDRVLEHSLIYAIIEIGNGEAVRPFASKGSSVTRRAALIALDQMPAVTLEPDLVVPLLASDDPVLKQTAAWIFERHPEWSDLIVPQLAASFEKLEPQADPDTASWQEFLANFATGPEFQKLIAEKAGDTKAAEPARLLALRVMGRAGLSDLPASWAVALSSALAADDEAVRNEAVKAARAQKIKPEAAPVLVQALRNLAGDASAPAAQRLTALSAIPGEIGGLEPETFAFLRQQLKPEISPMARAEAATALARVTPNETQIAELIQSLRQAGPASIPLLLSAIVRTPTEATGLAAIEALEQADGLATLPPGTLRAWLEKFPESVQTRGHSLLEKVGPEFEKQREHLLAVEKALPAGDIRRGQSVFNSTKAGCFACHGFGYIRGSLGPDLTSVGRIRTERDLLEAIVYPSASFVRSYEPVVVSTKANGKQFGLLREDKLDKIVLATGPNAEIHIPRDEIIELQPGVTSLMPQGFEQILTPQELADVIAFLHAAK